MHALITRPDALLQELDELDRSIDATLSILEVLRRHQNEITQTLDALTLPDLPSPPKQLIIKRGFEYLGKYVRCFNMIDVYLGVIQTIWRDFPEKRDVIAARLARAGHSRRYLATSPQALFPGWQESKARKYYANLVDGWFADTNLNQERMRHLLPMVVKEAGLVWGEDVRVYWTNIKGGSCDGEKGPR